MNYADDIVLISEGTDEMQRVLDCRSAVPQQTLATMENCFGIEKTCSAIVDLVSIP